MKLNLLSVPAACLLAPVLCSFLFLAKTGHQHPSIAEFDSAPTQRQEVACFGETLISTSPASCNGAKDGKCVLLITHESTPACCSNITSLKCEMLLQPSDIVGGTVNILPLTPGGFINFDNPILAIFDTLVGGTYHLRLTPNNTDCTTLLASNIMIPQPAAIVITATPVATPCAGTSSGKVTVTASGGMSPYSFKLSSGSTQPNVTTFTFTNLATGNYSVTVTDAQNCSAVKSNVVVGSVHSKIMADTSIHHVECAGGSDGTITFANITGGGGTGYSVLGDTANLTGGNYSVTVTSSIGCQQDFDFTINQPLPIILQTEARNVSCPGLGDGSLSAEASGGNGNFVFIWSTGEQTDTIKNLDAGTYSVVASDVKGCTVEKTDILISEPDTFDFTFQANNPVKSGSPSQVSLITASTSIEYFKWEIIKQFNIQGDRVGEQDSAENSIENTFSLNSQQTSGSVTYAVRPVYSATCEGEAVEIIVYIQPDADIFIPEILTPNGDSNNDFWQIILPPEALDGKVSVFNRSGGKVYDDDLSTAWDAADCPDGVYLYVVSYKFNGEDMVLKGALTILRSTH